MNIFAIQYTYYVELMPEWYFPLCCNTLCKTDLSSACHVILAASRSLEYQLSCHQNW